MDRPRREQQSGNGVGENPRQPERDGGRQMLLEGGDDQFRVAGPIEPQPEIDQQRDRQPHDRHTQFEEESEVTAVEGERPVENLPHLHGLKVGHALAPCGGRR